MRSDSDKTKHFFSALSTALPPGRARPGPGGSGPARTGATPTNFGSEALAPKETPPPHAKLQLHSPSPKRNTSASRPHTASHARTHTHTRTATETEIDFPIGHTPQSPTSRALKHKVSQFPEKRISRSYSKDNEQWRKQNAYFVLQSSSLTTIATKAKSGSFADY